MSETWGDAEIGLLRLSYQRLVDENERLRADLGRVNGVLMKIGVTAEGLAEYLDDDEPGELRDIRRLVSEGLTGLPVLDKSEDRKEGT